MNYNWLTNRGDLVKELKINNCSILDVDSKKMSINAEFDQNQIYPERIFNT
jgi:hypothetical protein